MEELAVRVKEAIGSKAKWDSSYIADLPNSSFAYICPNGDRKLPYKDAEGKVDLAHVRNALTRINQVKCGDTVISESLQDKIRSRLQKALASAKKSEKMAEKALSYTRETQSVSIAFERQLMSGYYVGEVLDDAVVVNSYDDQYDVYYKVSYTKGSDGTYEFAAQEDWVRGRYEFVATES